MSKLTSLILVILTGIIFYFGIQYQMHGDIGFHTDIARDFIVMHDMQRAGITLVGPRADWKGLFHGPLWFYFNYPAFVLGHGNPVVVGWFWVLCSLIFPGLYYFLFKDIIGKGGALIFSLLCVTVLMQYVQEFYNPVGATFMIPILVYAMYRYFKTHKMLHALLMFFVAGLIVQFQLAIGIPMTILVTLFLLKEVVRHKKYTHLFSMLIILIPLSTFIVFEVRHGFLQTQAVINHFHGDELRYIPSLYDRAKNRMVVAFTTGAGFLPGVLSDFNILGTLFMAFVSGSIFTKKKKHTEILSIVLFLYGGFYLISFVHSGFVLNHEFISLLFFPLLFFTALYEHTNKKVMHVLLIVILLANISYFHKRAQGVEAFQNEHKSWKFQLAVGKAIYEHADTQDVGVFVYAPDIYAYAPKYAALYASTLYPDKTMHFSTKLPETFIVYEPPPKDKPELNGTYFRQWQMGLTRPADETYELNGGFRLEKYLLSEEEQNVPHDPLIDDWVSQR
ncbi:glycosyltransferase family 39 protein [Candidatus Woesebacteria bacterium]|nr:glycosyltransferase family 39 protein [Candidatus Woesebacteria bacterium]